MIDFLPGPSGYLWSFAKYVVLNTLSAALQYGAWVDGKKTELNVDT